MICTAFLAYAVLSQFYFPSSKDKDTSTIRPSLEPQSVNLYSAVFKSCPKSSDVRNVLEVGNHRENDRMHYYSCASNKLVRR